MSPHYVEDNQEEEEPNDSVVEEHLVHYCIAVGRNQKFAEGGRI